MNFKPFNYLTKVFGNYFNIIAGLASIIGLFIVFLPGKNQVIIALSAFIVFLLIILLRIFWLTEQFLKNKSENGYDKLATIVRYRSEDGRFITNEIQKYIQCKMLIMDKHIHEYYWSGSGQPIVESDTMNFDSIKDSEDGYKKAILKFKNPLVYNGFFIVHIRMKMDDADQISKPYINMRVKEKTQLITFKVELFYKHGNHVQNARISKKKLATLAPAGDEYIDNIPFNTKTFSYEYNIYDPEVGYSYKIEWEK